MINEDTIFYFIIACISSGLMLLCAYVFPIGCRKNPEEVIDATVSGYDVFLDNKEFKSFNELSRNEQRDYIRGKIGKTDINDAEKQVYLFTYEYIRVRKKERIIELVNNKTEETMDMLPRPGSLRFVVVCFFIAVIIALLIYFIITCIKDNQGNEDLAQKVIRKEYKKGGKQNEKIK